MITKKKVALIMTGHLRTYKDNYENLKKNVLDNYDIDTFISTWDMNYIGSKRKSKVIQMSQDEIENRVKIYPNVKKTLIHNSNMIEEMFQNRYYQAKTENKMGKWDIQNKKYKLFPYETTWKEIVKICSAWYCVQEGFKLIENAEQYDILLRNRFDLLYFSPLQFKNYDLVVSPPAPKKKEAYKIRNYIQYGSPMIKDFMSNMSNYFFETMCAYRNMSSEHILEYILDIHFPNYYVDHDYQDLKHYKINS